MPAAQKKRLKKEQPLFEVKEQYNENPFVNDIRASVAQWREQRYPGAINGTYRLLDYWQRPDHGRQLFSACLKAMETAIYLLAWRRRQAAKRRVVAGDLQDGDRHRQNDRLFILWRTPGAGP